MLPETARRAIEQHFLNRGEAITQVSERGHAIIVASEDRRWQLELFHGDRHFRAGDGFQVLEVRPYIFADPPPRPHGVALLPDGSMFHLNDEGGFQAFFRRTRERLEPLELASLLARYQGQGPHLERHQNLIVSQDDLAGLLEEHQLEAIQDFAPLQSAGSSKGVLTLDFCTYYIAQEPPDDIFRVGLNLWRVKADVRGRLEWSVRPIARGLDSKRYSPR